MHFHHDIHLPVLGDVPDQPGSSLLCGCGLRLPQQGKLLLQFFLIIDDNKAPLGWINFILISVDVGRPLDKKGVEVVHPAVVRESAVRKAARGNGSGVCRD